MTRSTPLVIGLAVLVIGGAAGAQSTAKYKRNTPKINIKVEQTERTLGLREKPGAAKKDLVPEITADEFISIEGMVGNVRKEKIEEYRALIEDTPKNSPELPDLLFRLAEEYAKQQRYWRFKAMDMYSKLDKAPKGKKGSLTEEQKGYFAKEDEYLKQAIKIYSLLATNDQFKNYPRMDEALFYYAYTLQEAKRLDLSRTIYHKLINNYPQSKYIPFAYLSFADFFFESNDLDKAEKFYDKVLEFPKSPVYPYAMYKKGWVYLNQKREEDALQTFFDVTQKTAGKDKYKVLNKAAMKDSVRAYAEVGTPEKAYKFFQRIDKSYAFNMLKILATIYLDQGKAEKSIYTHRELIGIAPKDPEVCEWQYNVVQSMMGVGGYKEKVDEVQNLVKIYLKYRDTHVLKGSALQECGDNAQGTTEELAKVWHNEAIKTLNLETLGYVESLYGLYVDSFPKAKDIGEMRYYYADLLWSRAENETNQRLATERWQKAAEAFTDVIKLNKLPAAMQKDAAYAAVLGWYNALSVDPRTQINQTEMDAKQDESKIPTPQPIPERDQKMVSAFDLYLKYVKDPKDEELVRMKFFKARTLWRYDHLEEALPMFEDIVRTHLEHETAEYSVQIILDSLIRLHKYDELNKFADELATKKDWLANHADIHDRLADIRAKTKRKVAEDLQKNGNKIKAGEAYLEIFNDNPNGPNMDEVLYNAGVNFEDGKSIGLAIQMYKQLQTRFPKSVHTQKALGRMGNAFGAIAQYEQSAGYYEDYAHKYGGETDASKALSNAVTYRKGIGDDKKAIEDIEFFVKQYKNKLKKDAADAMFGMSGIYEKQGNLDMVVKHLERYIHDFGESGGRDRLVVANARIAQILWDQSCKGHPVDGACIKVERERAIRERTKRKHKNALPERCGEASKIKLTVLPRDKRLVGQAKAHFKTAIGEFAKGAVDSIPNDDPQKVARATQAVYWSSASRFYLSEEDYEGFLDVKFPDKLDFSEQNAKKKADSTKRFLKWKELKDKLGGKVNDEYKEVLGNGHPAWSIAAAARMAQISQNYADALYTAEIPKDVRTGPYAEDGVDAYCDALMDVATPLEERSIAGFSLCLDESTKRNWFNSWSKMCERELGQIRPQDFPTASELHADPINIAPVTDTQGLITAIKP